MAVLKGGTVSDERSTPWGMLRVSKTAQFINGGITWHLRLEGVLMGRGVAQILYHKEISIKNFLAMKFTTQHDLY